MDYKIRRIFHNTSCVSFWLFYILNSVALVRERTIPTERPPPVGEDIVSLSVGICRFHFYSWHWLHNRLLCSLHTTVAYQVGFGGFKPPRNSEILTKYQKLRKFYYMKWNFLYQITAASRTPDQGPLPPDPRSLCPQLNLLKLPPRIKLLGTPLAHNIIALTTVEFGAQRARIQGPRCNEPVRQSTVEFDFLVLWSGTNVAFLALCWMTLGGACSWWGCR
jgi:hypothetical protein